LSAAQLQALDDYKQNEVFNDLEKLVLSFAEQWTRHGRVESSVLTPLAEKLTQSQLVVLAATVALANWTNRFNETFGIPLP
jgi:alkylhydroperoxidase family enzyme